MTVQELIDILNGVENKSLSVFVFNDTDNILEADVTSIKSVDESMNDRIDLNI